MLEKISLNVPVPVIADRSWTGPLVSLGALGHQPPALVQPQTPLRVEGHLQEVPLVRNEVRGGHLPRLASRGCLHLHNKPREGPVNRGGFRGASCIVGQFFVWGISEQLLVTIIIERIFVESACALLFSCVSSHQFFRVAFVLLALDAGGVIGLQCNARQYKELVPRKIRASLREESRRQQSRTILSPLIARISQTYQNKIKRRRRTKTNKQNKKSVCVWGGGGGWKGGEGRT